MPKITHLTTVHPRYDTRIFLKECRSLTVAGYIVSLVVADGKGDEEKEGVCIYDVGVSLGRVDRIRNVTRRVFVKAIALDADVYHLHDPELLPFGLKLQKMGKKVIFDAHEDIPKQLMGKPYLNKPTRWVLSQLFSVYERWICTKLAGIITATPNIRDKFLSINPSTVDINNFPMLGELASESIDWSLKQPQVCYVGCISKIRGIEEIVQAMQLSTLTVRLQLGGRFSEADVEQRVRRLPGWQKVDALGFLNRDDVKSVLNRSAAGLVTLHPAINYIDALPVKMFEYMSAGVPVIASNFPLWKEIIEDNGCGLCVDPLNPVVIAEAIDYLVTHPQEAEQMGRKGQQAVTDKYNWAVEEKKLLEFYHSLTD